MRHWNLSRKFGRWAGTGRRGSRVDHDEKRALARFGDITTEATSVRMRASRMALGLNSKEMAEELGMPTTSYSAYENGKAHPKLAAIRYLYRQYDISFDFILYGDYRRLPADIQERIFDALLEMQTPKDQPEASG
jgi:transcriptional regulator with XRE-family HTH domain